MLLIVAALWLGAVHADDVRDLDAVDTTSAPIEEHAKVSEYDSFGSLSIGHLVTPNNKLTPKGKVGVGTMYIAYAPTDYLNIAVSPFAFVSFRMLNYMVRASHALNSRSSLGFDFRYFKTYNDAEADRQYRGRDRSGRATHRHPYTFHMEAYTANLTYNYRVASFYRANISAGYYYYVNDERPFSLRMDPANEDRYAANLTSLHEFRLSQNFFWNLEAGFWGLNYAYPYYHLGMTINLQNIKKTFLLGMGASTTFSPGFPADKVHYYAAYDSRQSIHPEIQVQIFF